MSETETETTTTETTTEAPAAPATPATKENVAAGYIATIAAQVKERNPEVATRWVQTQVDKEIDARVGLLDKAMQARFTAMTDLQKINRADNVHKDADGKVVFESWSDDRRKQVKEAKEKLAKIENAIQKAVEGDWSKVKEIK